MTLSAEGVIFFRRLGAKDKQMKVIIAEKPDQAAKLAQPFPHKKQQGYWQIMPNEFFPKGAYVTWAVGHICELVPPEAYKPEWKRWTLSTLPIIPDSFQHRVMLSKAKQFAVIKQLLKRPEVTGIIHAGDAGREGELIVRTIVQLCGVRKPMQRLWISSLTTNAIREGFRHLLDESETRNLYREAYSRACADWLVGMNASRVYTLLFREKGASDVFSAGRVQTPTLALVVKREKEIAQFRPEPFWEVTAVFDMDGKRYEGVWEKDGQSRIDHAELAQKIAAFCQGKPARVRDVKTERKEYQPPLLFTLSTLQATANKLYKYSPKKTLEIAQKLYLKGVLSYPRSDSSFVTEGEARTFPEILRKLSQQDPYRSFFPTPQHSLLGNRRYVNEKKVTDHYAIIPTEQVPDVSRLSKDERNIYDLVARRLIAAHFDAAVFAYTTVLTLVDGRAQFVSKGTRLVQPGWRQVVFQDAKQEAEEEKKLPPLAPCEEGRVDDARVRESMTQPPKRYTEGQLITLMKTVGKHVDDEELEKVLTKTEGLGTEATRAGIISMLKERHYIEVKQNQVYATPKGIMLIDAIGDKILASPEMTARWEQRLAEIGEGKASSEAFLEQVKKLSQKIVEDAMAQAPAWQVDPAGLKAPPKRSARGKASAKRAATAGAGQPGEMIGPCPACGGAIVDKGRFYGCSHYRDTQCGVTFPKKLLGKSLTPANLKKLLEKGKSNLVKGFVKANRRFDAWLVWDAQQRKLGFEVKQVHQSEGGDAPEPANGSTA